MINIAFYVFICLLSFVFLLFSTSMTFEKSLSFVKSIEINPYTLRVSFYTLLIFFVPSNVSYKNRIKKQICVKKQLLVAPFLPSFFPSEPATFNSCTPHGYTSSLINMLLWLFFINCRSYVCNRTITEFNSLTIPHTFLFSQYNYISIFS